VIQFVRDPAGDDWKHAAVHVVCGLKLASMRGQFVDAMASYLPKRPTDNDIVMFMQAVFRGTADTRH
jgi:hypothetical protein